MPLFFAISGLFAAAALTRPWRVVLRPRVGQNLYLHVLWLLIGFAVSTAVAVPTFMAPERLRDVPAAVATASTGLWYLYALAVYFVLARLTRRWPAAVPVAAAAVLAVVSFCGVLPGSGDTHSVVENLVWFLAGAASPTPSGRCPPGNGPRSSWGSGVCSCSCWPPSASSTRPSSSTRSSRSPRAQPRSWSASAWPCC